MLGGHVGSARTISATATVWPLSQVITRTGELRLEPVYTGAFRRAVQAHFGDSTQFHDPHGLTTLGLLHDQLVADPSAGLRTGFGQAKVDDWQDHALAEACLVKTEDGWAGTHVLQPDLPALPSCGSEPSLHFTPSRSWPWPGTTLRAPQSEAWTNSADRAGRKSRLPPEPI